ncbi:MAG: hypothetical protein HY399_02860 [Elusimicrobia bacterium]|nr:hypothetical protein [Elusimicrobiota bacterium]
MEKNMRWGKFFLLSLTVPLYHLTALPRPSEAAFYASSGKVDITPDLKKHKVWLAGYGIKGRKAEGIHDPLYARAMALSDGKKRVIFVALDLLGFFYNDVLDLRRQLEVQDSDELLFVTSTHIHSGPDTLGLWGRFPGVSGVDNAYRAELKEKIINLVRFLTTHMEPSELRVVEKKIPPKGLVKDIRDPVVIDPQLVAVHVRSKSKKPVGTLVRWSSHPEALDRHNHLVTSDFLGPLCAEVEKNLGGTCVFLPGIIGGLLKPDIPDGLPVEQGYLEAQRIGHKLGSHVVEAVQETESAYQQVGVDWRTRTTRLPVENSSYLVFLPKLSFGHQLLDSQGHPLPRWKKYWLSLRHLLFFPLAERSLPWIETEISWIRLGPLDILGIPGEIFPEMVLGGYRGEYRFHHSLLSPNNSNPPDLKKAPSGPYIKDLMRGRYNTVVGLASDELGYIIPEYDFMVQPTRTMSPRPPGHHYEETNSVGKRAAGIILKAVQELLAKT